MDLLAILRRSGGIDALARQIGLPPPEVLAAVETLLPVLIEDLRDYVRRLGEGDSGIAALLTMIEGLGGGHLAAEVMGPGPLLPERGESIQAQFLNQASEQMVSEMAVVSGQQAGVLARIMPLLAMLVCGYIAARAGTDGFEGENAEWLRELLASDEGDQPRTGSGTAG